jgi:hypothetical protein
MLLRNLIFFSFSQNHEQNCTGKHQCSNKTAFIRRDGDAGMGFHRGAATVLRTAEHSEFLPE